MNRGIFHAFEHLMQTDEVPYQEAPAVAPPAWRSPHAPDEAATAVARTAEALSVAPVHPMPHDSVLAVGAAFALANTGAVRGHDAGQRRRVPAGVPVLGRLVLRVLALFRVLVRLCCARGLLWVAVCGSHGGGNRQEW
ncbi:unnamed protein product [Miscanthus lutarioriparius]|uniref:Uncharacterized protein n=1 Tax=Miscanthus lutarioriparius TaxID=422564 RepID=A0A811R578_9POAL|nr:unnamed protein product [Miscanthus lutarioriparius]